MSDEFDLMLPGDDGWSEWVHPLPGYRIKCCDCGLVHEMEFEIGLPSGGADSEFNPGENANGVVIFRAKRGDGK